MKVRWIIGIALLFSLYAASSLKSESNDSELAPLKKTFLTLRNTDPDVERVKEWDALAGRFEKFVERSPKHAEAPSALLNASILYERLYRRLGEKESLSHCVKVLSQIARDYPGHRIADDALVRLGDIQLGDLEDKDGARRSYSEVVDAYHESDMYDLARTKLDQLAGRKPNLAVQKDVQGSSDQAAPQRKAGAPVIVLDPGHGGEDYGAVGIGGLLEKDVVLAVALQLEKLLRSELGAVVRLTRRKDVFVPLAERTALANDFEADLFISLHANASPGSKLSGFETFYLDNSGDKSSQALAERENRSVRFEGPDGDLAYMLSDLIQNAKLADSIRLANAVQNMVYSHLQQGFSVGRNFGVKKALFYVLVGAHMPCVLVEMGFIDNQADGSNLAEPQFRAELARGLFLGIQDFVSAQGRG